MIVWTALDTPVDRFAVAASDSGVVAVGFGEPAPLVRAVEGLGPTRGQPGYAVPMPSTADDTGAALLAAAVREIAEWAGGDRREFTVPVDWSLTSGLQRTVLRTLYETVPFGRTTTYGELAERCGVPGGARLVGQIMGSNPVPIIVPCHRVLASDSLGGYGPGVELKRRILVLEGVLAPSLFD